MTTSLGDPAPELAQRLPERIEQGRSIGRGRHPKITYPRHLSRMLLRARRERPSGYRTGKSRVRTTLKSRVSPGHQNKKWRLAK